MGVFRFILGILGVLLIIGAFSSFLPLFFLGGIATGSVGFAFGFPIFLMILGSIMVYYGFYYAGSKHKSNTKLIHIAKWGIIHTIAVLIGSYIISQLMIVNTLFVILLTSLVVSIVTQIVRSHDSKFKIKWFIFYFLIYANVIWLMGEFILPEITFQAGVFSSLVVGFTLAGVVAIVQKLNVRHNSLPWISIILAILLLVGNLGSLQISSIENFLEQSPNSSNLSENKLGCPSGISQYPLVITEEKFNLDLIGPKLNDLIETSVWRIEGDMRSCYKGKYKGQHPDKFYCDDMIVSRWETSNSGTIKYRWYTAVTAEWEPRIESFVQEYVFDTFSCENGKKVTVNKETTAYYVHVSRDGSEIKIGY
ncbi:hypothetical protein HOE52_03980 [Candidatus Woesearchaeota archaeon]|jgi:hypothetical protein|nr:hypothetical protein [Candidatus Woesearchaeota archaeon]